MLSVLAAFVFAGGEIPDLVQRLEQFHDAPVAALVPHSGKLPAITVDHPERASSLANMLRLKARLEGTPKSTSLYPSAWPGYLVTSTFQLSKAADAADRLISPWEVSVRGGQLTVKDSVSGYHMLGDLKRLNGKSLVLDPFFRRAVVTVACHDQPLEQALMTLSVAVGAKLVATQDSYEFRIDPKALRSRMIRFHQDRIRDVSGQGNLNQRGAYEIAESELAIETWRATTDNAISGATTGNRRIEVLAVGQSRIADLTKQRIAAWCNLTSSDGFNSWAEAQRLDWERPIAVVVSLDRSNLSVAGYIRGEPGKLQF